MSTSSPEHHKGGQIAQKGFLYQNSIAAFHLFEMLICAESVWRVSTEVAEPVDDILVEKLRGPADFYQVKCYENYTDWTVQRLVSHNILQAFMKQLAKSHGNCRLILSSPIPYTEIHALAQIARDVPSHDIFLKAIPTNLLSSHWSPLVNVIGSTAEAYQLLRAYYEEPWPPNPQHLQEICLGRYQHSPYAALPGIWNQLCDIAQREALRGKAILRTDLIELLHPRFELGTVDQLEPPDIRMARYTAQPGWYIHREEESKVLIAVHSLLQGKAENVLVMGDGGTGKSSFFSWMRRELSEYKGVRIVDVSAEGGDPSTLLDSLNAGLKLALNTLGPRSGEVTSKTDLLRWHLRELGKAGNVVVLAVDHVESFFSSIFRETSSDKIAQAKYSIFNAIEQTAACRNVMWVLFARSEYFFLMFPENESLRRLKMESWVRLDEFSDQQAGLLLDRLVTISKLNMSEDAKRLLLRNSPRNPLKLILTFINLTDRVGENCTVTGDIVLQRQPWIDVFQQDFNSLDETESAVVYAIASLMQSSARRFFLLEEIHESLSGQFDNRERISKNVLADVLHRIQETKRLLQQPVAGRYGLYHENFASYVISQYGGRVRTAESQVQFRDFMAMFMHTAKAPLQRILDELQKLEDLERSARQGDSGAQRREAVKDLRTTFELYLNEFRTSEFFAKRGQDRIEDTIARERLSLTVVIQRVAAQFQPMAEKRFMKWQLRLPACDMVVLGDEGMLSTVLGNIIHNAIKFSQRADHIQRDAGKVVQIEAREMTGQYQIAISNIGVGIPESEIGRIFQPYFQGNQSHSGMGIGLYVAKRIVEALGGRITAKSVPLSHTTEFLVTFTVVLPKAR